MGKYFQKTLRPDIINGDVSTVIASNKADVPFQIGDLLFDWTPVDIPMGTDSIIDAVIHSYGEDGSAQPGGDFHLLIAKSNNGAAPTSLGAVNSAPAGCFELPDILIGMMKFEGTTSGAGNLDLGQVGTFWYWTLGGATTNRIYIGAIHGINSSGQFDFSTGVLLNDASDVADDAGTSLTVDGVDPRKAFRVGDTVYIHDVDTPIGTIASLGTTNITLTSNNVGAIADDDEFMNAKPMTITLGFRGR